MNSERDKTIRNILVRWKEGTLSKDKVVLAIEGMFETIEVDVSISVQAAFVKLGGCTLPLVAA